MRAVEKEGASIFLAGSFNPAIFQPHWLGSQGLIRPEEAENAAIGIIGSQVADFQTDWFRMQVLQNRFTVQCLDATYYGPIKDLVAGIFSLLRHTPVSRLGMSRYFHFQMDSLEIWHEVGHELAPKEIWRPLIQAPGLRSMTIEGRRSEMEDGTVFVKVEPSSLVQPGVFVEVIEDFVRFSEDEDQDAQWVPGRIGKQWDAVLKYAEDVAQGLLAALL
ncbi:MAG TPA: hypothetical protein VKG25_17060, partial [Bryobacteraceae bacterium]|nr:hypothetical protein [Bryobacteraceae bacterium]